MGACFDIAAYGERVGITVEILSREEIIIFPVEGDRFGDSETHPGAKCEDVVMIPGRGDQVFVNPHRSKLKGEDIPELPGQDQFRAIRKSCIEVIRTVGRKFECIYRNICKDCERERHYTRAFALPQDPEFEVTVPGFLVGASADAGCQPI